MNQNHRNGTIHVRDDRASIVFVRRLPFPIDRVWAAITDPKERAVWFGPTSLDPEVGGKVAMTAEGPPAPPDMRRVVGKILVWDPPRVFELEWHQAITGATVVRYELERDGDETILHFTHSGLKISHAKGYVPGEHAYLDRMEAYLTGQTLPPWSARYAELEPEYQNAL
jgi:uncharacterized protein YndB with AHSA1/START domain